MWNINKMDVTYKYRKWKIKWKKKFDILFARLNSLIWIL